MSRRVCTCEECQIARFKGRLDGLIKNQKHNESEVDRKWEEYRKMYYPVSRRQQDSKLSLGLFAAVLLCFVYMFYALVPSKEYTRPMILESPVVKNSYRVRNGALEGLSQ